MEESIREGSYILQTAEDHHAPFLKTVDAQKLVLVLLLFDFFSAMFLALLTFYGDMLEQDEASKTFILPVLKKMGTFLGYAAYASWLLSFVENSIHFSDVLRKRTALRGLRAADFAIHLALGGCLVSSLNSPGWRLLSVLRVVRFADLLRQVEAAETEV